MKAHILRCMRSAGGQPDDFSCSIREDNRVNLFKLIFDMTHFRVERKWKETNAVFTGRRKPAVTYTRLGTRKEEYDAYEIVYSVDGIQQYSWYSFYPLPDPDAEELAGKEIRIRYYIRKPYVFEYAGEDSEDTL